MRSLLRQLAWSASWGGRPADRRRAAVVALAAAAFTVVAAGLLGAWLQADRAQARAAGRSFATAAPGEPVAFEHGYTYDELPGGQQVSVFFWRMRARTARIPGVPGRPPPGSWFVSPALLARIDAEPALRRRYPAARPIGRDGVGTADELIAYRFVGPGMALPDRLAARPSGGSLGPGAELELLPVAVAAALLLGVPGIGLLLAAVGSTGPALERRLALLDALGAPVRIRLAVAAASVAAAGAPGAVAAAVAAGAVSRRLVTVPLVGRPVLRGDLALPLASLVLLPVAVVAVVAVVAALAAGWRRVSARPTEPLPDPIRLDRAVPLAVGLGLLAFAAVGAGAWRPRLFVTALLVTVVGAVRALPLVFDGTGRRLARTTRVTPLLVGRRLSWDARRGVRPLTAVVAVTATLPALAAWVGVARTADPAPRAANAPVVLSGSPLPAGVQDALLRRWRAAAFDVVEVAPRDPTQPPESVLVGDCSALARVVPVERCDRRGFRLARKARARLDDLVDRRGVSAVPAGALRQSTVYLLAGGRDAAGLEEDLRVAALNGTATDRSVTVPARYRTQESPLVAWILGAAAAAAALTVASLLLAVLSLGARAASTRARLVALGVAVPVVRRLSAAEAGLAVAVVAAMGTSVGALAAWLFGVIDPVARFPVAVVAGLVAMAVVAAAGSGASAALAVSEPAYRLRPGDAGD